MKVLSILILILISSNNILAQSIFGVGARIKVSDFAYHYSDKENNTDIFYTTPCFELIGTNSFNQKKSGSKIKFGYTFEVGFSAYKFNRTNTYLPLNPYWVSDTIGYQFNSSYKGRKIQFSNFIDIKVKVSNKLTFITSLGFKLENRDGNKKIDNSHQSNHITISDNYSDIYIENREKLSPANYINRFPLNFKFIIIPQLQIELSEFYLTVQLFQDLLNINKYIRPIDLGGINYRTFTGLGIIISPNSSLKKRNHYNIKH